MQMMSPNRCTYDTTWHAKSKLVPPPAGVSQKSRPGKNRLHLDGLVPSSADDLVRDEVDAVHLISVSRQIDSDLVFLQVPQLP